MARLVIKLSVTGCPSHQPVGPMRSKSACQPFSRCEVGRRAKPDRAGRPERIKTATINRPHHPLQVEYTALA